MTSIVELDKQYDDYIERRERDGFLKRVRYAKAKGEAGKNNQDEAKRPPSGRFEPKKKDATDGNSKAAIEKSYALPSNVYHSSGYEQRLSELGQDPLTAVRTLRNNMRNMALEYRDKDRPVKLSKSEGDLLRMNEKRSNAILVGDTKLAEKIKHQMEQYKEQAVRNTYADLVMEDDEMKAFGVKSEWTPNRGDRTGTQKPEPVQKEPAVPVIRGTQTESDPRDGPFVPRSRAVAPRKAQSRPSSQSRKKSPDVVRDVTSKERPSTVQRQTKKNDRLSAMGGAMGGVPDRRSSNSGDVTAPVPYVNPAPQYDDPFQIPRQYGTCHHCGESDTGFGNKSVLEDHYTRSCRVMNRCRFCLKVILVSQLTDHYLRRCQFLDDKMTSCTKCGLAMDKIDANKAMDHPLCRGRAPPAGTQWCPLCSVAVTDNKKSWLSHLTSNCYNNPRKDGPEPETFDMVEPLEGGKNQIPSDSKGDSRSSGNGRMIDADKLVVALQDIQLKKKKKRQEAMAAIEAGEAAPTT